MHSKDNGLRLGTHSAFAALLLVYAAGCGAQDPAAEGEPVGIETAALFTSWNSDYSDANGWNQAKYYTTLDFPDIDGGGRADVCGRGSFGITCALSSGSAFTGTAVWSSNFSDANGWGSAQHYRTVKYPDVNNDSKADVCGRGTGGVTCAVSNGSSFTGAAVWNNAFSDANGWTQAKYYTTIAFPQIDASGGADVCGRGSGGINCATSTGSAFTGTAVWNSSFSDANGWGSAQYYSTIKYPDVTGDGKADVCGRGTSGVNCAVSSGSAFTGTSLWEASFSDANGFNSAQYYSTIAFPDLNGDGKADICARGISGLYCGISSGSAFSTVSLWSNAFSDANGWTAAKYYSTIMYRDMNGDGRADVCARGSQGVICANSSGSAFGNVYLLSAGPSDANAWDTAPYYSTLRLANIDSDATPEVCGRGFTGIFCEN